MPSKMPQDFFPAQKRFPGLKKASIFLAVGALLGCLMTLYFTKSSGPPPVGITAQVYFSPNGGCTDAVVNRIDAAKTKVFVQAYSFTSKPIANALIRAHKRDVNVIVVVDKSQRGEKHTQADEVYDAGIKTYVDAKHAIAHNKVIMIDGYITITGSFNFSEGAETRNAENLDVIEGADFAKLYEDEWEKHLAHSVQYEKPAAK